MLCLPRFRLPDPRSLRCVWRAVLSGCPLSSLAGMPFHVVCAFRGLGPVALLVFPACPLCVCALALPRRPGLPPLPWLVWRTHLARSRCRALVGPFHAVRAPTRVLPPSRAPFGLLFLGGGLRFPTTWLGAVCSPWGGSARLGRSSAGEWGGGGVACAPFSPTVRPGGPVGREVALPRSVPLPSLGRQQSGCPWPRSGHEGRGSHTAPVCAHLLSPGAVSVAPLCVGGGSLVHCGSCVSRRLGPGGRPCSGLPPRRRGPAGGGHPLCHGGGGGPAPPWLADRLGGLGGQGGGRAVAPHLPLPGAAACGPLPSPPFVAGASYPGVRVRTGSCGSPGRRLRPAARGPARRGEGGGGAAREPPPRRGGWGGGGPGGRSASGHPSALPGRATMRASLATLRSPGARPPYCSGSLSRAAPGRVLCVVLAR